MNASSEMAYLCALADHMAAFKRDQGISSWDVFLASQGFTEGALSDRKMAYFLAPV